MATRVRGGQKLDKFLRDARAAQSRSKKVDVGFFSSARYPPVRQGKNGGQKQTPHFVATVAAFNEFGTSAGTPERPFFRNAIADAKKPILEILKAGIDPKDMTMDARLAGIVGEKMKSEIQKSIINLRDPPNAPRTIKRKGSSNPLIDTGFMNMSVSYNVDNAD